MWKIQGNQLGAKNLNRMQFRLDYSAEPRRLHRTGRGHPSYNNLYGDAESRPGVCSLSLEGDLEFVVIV